MGIVSLALVSERFSPSSIYVPATVTLKESINVVEKTITFERHLADLPPARRDEIEQVWEVVRASIPAGYVEQVGARSLTYTADGEMYVALINGKNYISLHLMPIYMFPELKIKLEASGKRLKGGKSCVNFLRAEELPLDAIAEIINSCSAEDYKEQTRKSHVRSAR